MDRQSAPLHPSPHHYAPQHPPLSTIIPLFAPQTSISWAQPDVVAVGRCRIITYLCRLRLAARRDAQQAASAPDNESTTAEADASMVATGRRASTSGLGSRSTDSINDGS